jgi:hypothetical protein
MDASDMAATLTEYGSESKPPSVCRPCDSQPVDKNQFRPRGVLARNLKALMGAGREGPSSQLALSKKSGVAQATIGRILRQETAASIETVEELAKVYGLEGWQLMVAGMDPSNPPVLVPISRAERALYDSLKAAMKEAARQQ